MPVIFLQQVSVHCHHCCWWQDQPKITCKTVLDSWGYLNSDFHYELHSKHYTHLHTSSILTQLTICPPMHRWFSYLYAVTGWYWEKHVFYFLEKSCVLVSCILMNKQEAYSFILVPIFMSSCVRWLLYIKVVSYRHYISWRAYLTFLKQCKLLYLPTTNGRSFITSINNACTATQWPDFVPP